MRISQRLTAIAAATLFAVATHAADYNCESHLSSGTSCSMTAGHCLCATSSTDASFGAVTASSVGSGADLITIETDDATTITLEAGQTYNLLGGAGIDTNTSGPDININYDPTEVPLSGDVATSALVATIQPNAVALTTDTTGNYAAGDGEAGNALTGDSATAFFSAGTIEAARGGTALDTSASSGVPWVTSGTWSVKAPSDDAFLIGASATGSAWDTVPDCDGASQALIYDATTNNLQCGTISASASWSSLTAPTGAVSMVSDDTAETVTFDFQSAFSASQFIIKQTTGNPTAGQVLEVSATDPSIELAKFNSATGGGDIQFGGADDDYNDIYGTEGSSDTGVDDDIICISPGGAPRDNARGAYFCAAGNEGVSGFVPGAIWMSSSNLAGSGVFLRVNGTNGLFIDHLMNVVVNNAGLATTATDGFLYIPSMAGTPTGNSTDYTNRLPLVFDRTNFKLCVNTSGTTWKCTAAMT